MASSEKKLSSVLKEQGYEGVELFEKIATRTVELKEKSRTNRCSRCWHDEHTSCICSYIPALPQVKLPIKVMILMHYKEYLSAGNDAKLLLALLPDAHKEFYIFGREGDWDKFEAECSVDPSHTVLLWPAEDALTVDDFVSRLPSDSPWRECRQSESESEQRELSKAAIETMGAVKNGNNSTAVATAITAPTLRVVVLDGVYSQARAMFRAMKRRFPGSIVPPYVALHPETLSVYHRAQKNYAQSSGTTVLKSSDPKALHICTVEAFALLMKELGEWEETTRALVRAVEVNNLALIHSADVRPPVAKNDQSPPIQLDTS